MHDPKRGLSERLWTNRNYTVWHINQPFNPPMDVIELADRILVMVEIAGMRANQFAVAIAGRELIISGARERPPVNATGYLQMEVGYGEFRVEVSLPYAVDHDHVTATYRDGFLQVELPREPESRHYQIEVVTEEQDADEQ